MSQSSSGSKAKVPQSINNGKFEITKKIGSGCFGEVYRGIKKPENEEVAIKFEDLSSGAPQLEHEASILNILRQPTLPQGIAEYFYFGKEGAFHCMVMECLGKSLEDRVQGSGGKLSVKTTTLVADQLLRRIEYLHSKCIVHRDIKSENFMWGIREKMHHLYLIDFGLSKTYWDKKRHVVLKQKLNLTGTARYASLNAHRGIEQSRRDDLEAIGHMLMYFLRGALPWSGLDAKNKQEKYRKIKEKKENTPLHTLCGGFPDAYENYLSYTRNLGFKDRPDYNMLRKLFQDVRSTMEKKEGKTFEDKDFEWFEGAKLQQWVPLQPWVNIPQPDDTDVGGGSSGGCCCIA